MPESASSPHYCVLDRKRYIQRYGFVERGPLGDRNEVTDFIKFESSKPEALQAFGLDFHAVLQIFLVPGCSLAPRLPAAFPDWAKAFILREYRASEITFTALRDLGMVTPHPVTAALARCTHNFARVLSPNSPLTLFKAFGDSESGYCLAFAGLTGRVTHIVVPSRDCVIYDLDLANARWIWDANEMDRKNRPIGSTAGLKIGIVDMVTNFAHQAMNHLSGLERVVDSGIHQHLDEIWVCGIEFFGPARDFFPEIANKIRRIEQHEVISRLDTVNCDAYQLGSNVLTSSLRTRIQRSSNNGVRSTRNHNRSPIIAFTIRSGGRRCRNLPDVLENVVTALLKIHPKLGIILDGWVFPEDAIQACSNALTAVSKPYLNRMLDEAELCRDLARHLPAGVLVGNTVGTSMLDSISALQVIDAYVAHIGTLQHKIGWFTSTSGIVHGPSAELSRMDSSTYSCEEACRPLMISPDAVIDIPVDTTRGPGFFDYEIKDTSNLVEELRLILEKRLNQKSK